MKEENRQKAIEILNHIIKESIQYLALMCCKEDELIELIKMDKNVEALKKLALEKGE